MTKNVYLEEYESKEAVPKYVSRTAGAGIAHVLQDVYGPIYDGLLGKMSAQAAGDGGFRVLEYGCGGGMNALWIVRRILQRGLPLDLGCGTDFAPSMVEAAKKECLEALNAIERNKVSFHAVANENLARELPQALGRVPDAVMGSFHLITGVNTFRYCFRINKQAESARGIYSLLRPGGYTVMIDMNRHFPFFRSKMRNKHKPEDQTYLPTLEEYDAVFRQAGFEIVTKKNVCWIPHSAGTGMTTALKICTPVLDALFSRYATRSLIVARRPH
jgi:SAM-dependent methyltransferase